MDISKKSLGELMDELSIINMKIWATQDIVALEDNDSKVAEAARKAVKLNGRRNQLIDAINGVEISTSEKIYV